MPTKHFNPFTASAGTTSAGIALLCAITIVLAALVAHFFGLDATPRGFYVDESSIAYNAWLIAHTGADEHGERWPLFFRAFGEYKNPLYIYLVAFMYRLFGYSEWITRAASGVCWLFGSVMLMELGRRLFANALSLLYLLLCVSFTPWLFSLSRISFELIILYPLLALYLLAIYRAYEEQAPHWAAIAGLSMGLCVYAYSTFRLLAPLHVLVVLMNYPARKYWRRHAGLLLGAAVAAAPFALYLLQHGDNLLVRFNSLTFMNDRSIGLGGRLATLARNYIGYFSLDFLAARGDPNLRHHTGQGGQLLQASFLLLAAGLAWLASTGRLWRDAFPRLLVAGCLLAPLGAALTSDQHHSLRALSLAVFALIISAWAVHAMAIGRHRRIAILAVAFTTINAAYYTGDYFRRYAREESARAFEGYGFREALNTALMHSTKRVIVSTQGNQPYIQALFYTSLMPSPPRIPVQLGEDRQPGPGELLIRFAPGDSYNRERWGLPAQSQFVILGERASRQSP